MEKILRKYDKAMEKEWYIKDCTPKYKTQQLRDILENAEAAIASFRVFKNKDYQFDYFSTGCQKIYGYTPEELIANQELWMSRIYPEDLENVIKPCYERIFSEQSFTLEFRFYHQDGSLKWISSSYSVKKPKKANYWQVVVVNTDISARYQAEEAIKQKASLFRSLFEQAGVGIAVTNIEGKLLKVNRQGCNILGYEEAELLNHCFTEFTDPEDIKLNLQYFHQLLRGERQYFSIEKRYIHKNGSRVWVNLTATLLDNSLILAIIEDISDRKNAEFALRTSEANLTALIENTDGSIWSIDSQYRLIKANSLFINNLTKVLQREVITHESVLFPSLPADVLEEWKGYYDRALAGEKFQIEIQRRFNYPDNWVNYHFAPIKTSKGEIVGVTIFGRDITERKKTEQALHESEERMRLALEAANMGTWDWNIVTNEVIWSESLEKLMGMEPGKFDGKFETVTSLIHPDDLNKVIAAINGSLERKEKYQIEFRFIKPDGNIRWALGNGNVIRDDVDRPIRMLGVDMEITERKKAEQALKESRQQYQDLVDSVDGIVWELDYPAFKFTFVCQEAEKILGYSLEQWFNEPNFWQNHIHPDDRNKTLNFCLSQSQQGKNHDFTYRMIKADGSKIWLRNIVHVILKDNHPIKLRGIMIDITKSKSDEAILKQYQKIVSTTKDAIALLDCNLRYILANQSYLNQLQKQSQEIIGHSISELLDPETYNQIIKPQLEVCLKGKTVSYDLWYKFPHLGEQFLSVTYVPYYRDNQTISGIIISIRNLTKLKKAEKLIWRQAEQEHILTGIVNQIRQSINLKTILNTTVSEVGHYLQSDRVLLYSLNANYSGKIIAEFVTENCNSILGFEIFDPCLSSESLMTAYKQGKIHNISDIYNSQLSDCYLEMLSSFEVKAILVIPIIQNQKVWGFLIAHHCQNTRIWQQEEINLLQQLSNHVAIAIEQSELYEQLKIANEQLNYLANHDPLTKIANRRYFEEYLQQEYQKATLERNYLSIILCDVDYFKLYNDTYGHPAGDECLKQVAQILSNSLKSSADLVARYGGEEFIIILPNSNIYQAITIVRNIQEEIETVKIAHKKSQVSEYVTLSFGIASEYPKGGNPETLIKQADKALYQAKLNGRNQFSCL